MLFMLPVHHVNRTHINIHGFFHTRNNDLQSLVKIPGTGDFLYDSSQRVQHVQFLPISTNSSTSVSISASKSASMKVRHTPRHGLCLNCDVTITTIYIPTSERDSVQLILTLMPGPTVPVLPGHFDKLPV